MSAVQVVATRSNKDFIPALRDLMATAELSQRQLVERTKDHRDGGYALGYLTTLLGGRSKPAPETMRVFALAAGVEPEYFKEYREHLAATRAAELATRIGLDEVLAALESVDKPARRRR